MMECLILGDSIATGIRQIRTECASHAIVGYNSQRWNKEFLNKDLTANTVIISLGSNDHKGINTKQELIALRRRVNATRVFWVLPAIKENIQEIVREVAIANGDIVLPIKGLQVDRVHPSWAGYKQLAEASK